MIKSILPRAISKLTQRQTKIIAKNITPSAHLKVGVFTEGMLTTSYAYPSLKAFAEGIAASGDHVQFVEKTQYQPCDIAVIFGDVREGAGKEKRMAFKAEVKGRHIHRGLIIIDTAIMTRATHQGVNYRRIGIDGLLNDEADFNNHLVDDLRREKIFSHTGLSLKPWQEDGDHILIALQRPLDASLRSSSALRARRYFNWLKQTVKTLRENSHRTLYLRPHPDSQTSPEERAWLAMAIQELGTSVEWDMSARPFHEIIKNCWTCVTFNSGAGVDAALAGVPIITCDPGSFAWDVSHHDPALIEKPLKPDRTRWINALAYAEWNLNEISQGLPWQHLKKKLITKLL